jgi:outer membrane protein OmpA-like peptidoglycan-associated protein
MRELSDVHFPEADRIRMVLDNLSTHSSGALYQAFPPCEARRVLRRLEFHYVPKHASWLNMVEIEIGVLRGQCLDRRIATPERLVSEIAAWERQRNATRAQVKWMFTTEKARAKMGRAYPEPASIKAHPTKESLSLCNGTSVGGAIPEADRDRIMSSLKSVLGPQFAFATIAGSSTPTASSALTSGFSVENPIGDPNRPTLNLPSIYFATNSAEVPSDTKVLVQQAAGLMKQLPAGTTVRISGYTDVGTRAANMSRRSEGGVEAFYNLAITPWLRLSADLQVIDPWNPSKSRAAYAALRLQTKF